MLDSCDKRGIKTQRVFADKIGGVDIQRYAENKNSQRADAVFVRLYVSPL